MIIAILSTTVLPIDGQYSIQTLSAEQRAELRLSDIAHYVGHPDTKAIVELLGAVPAPTRLFAGLQVGESAICVPIAQGKSTRATEGFTSPHQVVDAPELLEFRLLTRIG